MLVGLLRFVGGVLVAAILGYVLVANAPVFGFGLLPMMVVLGLATGIIMASWWSLLLAPAAWLGAAEVWYRLVCANCSRWSAQNEASVLFGITLMLAGTVAIGAAAGTVVGRRLTVR